MLLPDTSYIRSLRNALKKCTVVYRAFGLRANFFICVVGLRFENGVTVTPVEPENGGEIKTVQLQT